MTDQLARTIAEIRAGRVARCTRTELLELCDAAERPGDIAAAAIAPVIAESMAESYRRGLQQPDDELRRRVSDLARARDVVVVQRDEALSEVERWRERVRDLEERLSRARAALDGRP